MTLTVIILILTACLLTVTGVGLWRRVALQRQILDLPNERSSHTQPTPRGGGIIITSVTILLLVLGVFLSGQLAETYGFFIGAVLIAVVSWFDDLYSLPNYLRFGVHLIAAAIAIYSFGFFGVIELPLLTTLNLASYYAGQALTLLWIVGLTNAYNFMDGIDGIAGAQGVTAGIGWLLIGLIIGQPIVILIGGLLAATCAGFLWHNWHPAKIFMGDVSSAFLGYSFAVVPLLAIKHAPDLIDGYLPLIALLLVWTFVFDATLTFFRRAYKRENVFAAHRSHLYQRLVIAGFRHDTVTSLYTVLSVLGAAAAVVWGMAARTLWVDLMIVGFIFSSTTALWLFVDDVEQKASRPKAEESL